MYAEGDDITLTQEIKNDDDVFDMIHRNEFMLNGTVWLYVVDEGMRYKLLIHRS